MVKKKVKKRGAYHFGISRITTSDWKAKYNYDLVILLISS